MFKKIFIIIGITNAIFIDTTIYAGEAIKINVDADQIMLPITTGTYTFHARDFSSTGTINQRVDVSYCPTPYLYPYVMAYPNEVVTGDGDWCSYNDIVEPNVRLIKNLAIVPTCDKAGCNLAIAFGSLFYDYNEQTKEFKKYIVPAVSACYGGSDGYLTITYVVYCSTKPMQNDTDKYELNQTK